MLSRAQIAALSDEKLFLKICEEASEVIKAVCKHGAHGPTPTFAGVQYDNVCDSNEEHAQLNDLMHEYRGRFGYRGYRDTAPE
jgi:phosphoribosyl-ATP pyrophosphohydrolase